MNRADLQLIQSMTPAECKIEEIKRITSGEELAAYLQERAYQGRPWLPGELDAVNRKDEELRASEKRAKARAH